MQAESSSPTTRPRHAAAGGVAWRVSLLPVACGLLLGCGDASDVVTLWHQMRPDDRRVLQERLAAYEAAHPGVEVRELYKETEELRSGLESAVLVGRGPDIVYGPSDPLGVYQAIGALRDMSPWFSDAERAEFDERALVELPAFADPDKRELVFVGDRFGNHLALVYNRLLIDRPPTTTDELVAFAKRATVDEDGDGRPDRYGLVWNYTEPFFVLPFLGGYGAWVFDEGAPADEPPRPNLDTPEATAAYRFVASLRNEHGVLPASADYENAAARFKAGGAAMLIDGDWSWQGYFKESAAQRAKAEAGRAAGGGREAYQPVLDAAVAVLPTVSATGRPMGGVVAPKGYSMSIAASGDRAERAADVIRFLTDEATQRVFFERQKIYPSRTAVRDPAVIEADATLRASIAQIESSRPMPTAIEMRAVWDAMRPPYQQLMAGQIDAADAAQRMQRNAVAKIATLTRAVEPDATAPLVTWLGLGLAVAALVWLRRGVAAMLRDLPGNRLAYLLALPAVLLIFATVLFPLAYNVVLSFSNMSLQNFRDWRIVGFHNYASLLTGGGAGGLSVGFWRVFGMTLFWTAVNVTLHVAIGVFLAVVLNGPVRGKSVYRVALIIPWAVPAYITALTWRGMFDAEFGAVNKLVAAVNGWLPGMLRLPEINWLTEAGPAFAACVVANVWLGFPFMMVVALGGLQGIPQELYEAARIDRATRWQQFWHVTAPMLRPVMLPAITLGAVWTFNNLNVVWLVSNGGEPADQTHILVSYVYKAVFNLYQYGYGAALSMVIFAMLLAFSVVFLSKTQATEAVA